MTTIYTHHSCGSYFLTPLHLYEHLWNAHPDSTLAVQTALGQQGLHALVIRQELHTSSNQPGATRVYLCSTCQLIFPTSFAAQAHLERTQQHDAEVQRARWLGGHAGVAQLVTGAWLEPVGAPVAAPAIRALPATVGAPVAAPPAIVLTADVCLNLRIKSYTNRDRYPAEISLAVRVPRVTATVSALAERIEEAFVILGGERDRIDWTEMINVVGLTIDVDGLTAVGRTMHLKNDQDVRAWMRAAGAEESGELDGDAD